MLSYSAQRFYRRRRAGVAIRRDRAYRSSPYSASADGRRRERQNIDIGAHRLTRSCGGARRNGALIDNNQQAEVAQLHIAFAVFMRTIRISIFTSAASAVICVCSLALRKRDKVSQCVPAGENGREAVIVLLRQQRSRHQYRHPFMVFHRQNAARIATSVLPRRRQPHTSPSIASGWHISLNTALIACA